MLESIIRIFCFALFPQTPEVWPFVGVILLLSIIVLLGRFLAYHRSLQEARQIEEIILTHGKDPHQVLSRLSAAAAPRLARRLHRQMEINPETNRLILRSEPEAVFRSSLETLWPWQANAVRILPGIILTFGLMTTFIFLGSGINESAAGLGGDATVRNGGIQGLLQAAGGKFSTSIYGLACYILLTLVAALSDRPASIHRRIVESLVEIADLQDPAMEASRTQRAILETLRASAEQAAEGQQRVIDAITAQKGDLTEAMRQIGESLQMSLIEARKQDADALQVTLDEIRDLMQRLANDQNEKIHDEIRKAIQGMTEHLGATLNEMTGRIEQTLAGVGPALEKIVSGSTNTVTDGLLGPIAQAAKQIQAAAAAMEAAMAAARIAAIEEEKKRAEEARRLTSGMLQELTAAIAATGGTQRAQVAEALQPLLQAAQKATTDLLGAASSAADQIRQAADGTSTAIEAARASAKEAFQEHLQTLKETARKNLAEIEEQLARSNEEQRRKLLEHLGPTLKTLDDLGQRFRTLEGAMTTAANRMNEASSKIESAAANAAASLEGAAHGVQETLAQGGFQAKDALIEGGQTVKDSLETASLETETRIKAAGTALANAITQMQEEIQKIMGLLRQHLQDAIQSVQSAGNNARKKVENTGTQAGEEVTNTVRTQIALTEQAITDAVRRVSKAAEEVATAMDSLKTSLQGVEDLPNVVVERVQEATNSLTESVERIPNSVSAAVEGIAEATAPLKEFAKTPQALERFIEIQKTLTEAARSLEGHLSGLAGVSADVDNMRATIQSLEGLSRQLAETASRVDDSYRTLDQARDRAFTDALNNFRRVLQDLLTVGEILADARFDRPKG